MEVLFTREDFEAFGPKSRRVRYGANEASGQTVKGDMSIPEPMKVNVNGDMDQDVFKQCSTTMSVCVNMVQKMLTDAANKAGIKPADALRNIDAWVAAFVDFPLPVFNFTEAQSQVYNNNEFSLSANPGVVESVVNIKNVADLKDAVLKALRDSGPKGNLASYSHTDKYFTYFGIISGYTKASIDIRVVSYQMHMAHTEVKTLCGGTEKTELHSSYDTFVFSGDSNMMQKLAAKMEGQLIDYFAQKLYDFIVQFYADELADYQKTLDNIFGGK